MKEAIKNVAITKFSEKGIIRKSYLEKNRNVAFSPRGHNHKGDKEMRKVYNFTPDSQ